MKAVMPCGSEFSSHYDCAMNIKGRATGETRASSE